MAQGPCSCGGHYKGRGRCSRNCPSPEGPGRRLHRAQEEHRRRYWRWHREREEGQAPPRGRSRSRSTTARRPPSAPSEQPPPAPAAPLPAPKQQAALPKHMPLRLRLPAPAASRVLQAMVEARRRAVAQEAWRRLRRWVMTIVAWRVATRERTQLRLIEEELDRSWEMAALSTGR